MIIKLLTLLFNSIINLYNAKIIVFNNNIIYNNDILFFLNYKTIFFNLIIFRYKLKCVYNIDNNAYIFKRLKFKQFIIIYSF